MLLPVMLAALAALSTGCGGINTGTTVSPASFFLPGLLRNDTTTNAPSATPDISKELASVN
ncbi:MAG TPA: hypothetical protein VGI03_13595 [Verrucomicrobiae bacterium]